MIPSLFEVFSSRSRPTATRFDKAEELRKKWKVEPGQLWTLGDHRLLCGDSTNTADVKRLMNGERAVLFATDPPYLVGYDGTNHPGKRPKTNTDWSGTYGKTWDEADAKQNSELYDRFIRVAVETASLGSLCGPQLLDLKSQLAKEERREEPIQALAPPELPHVTQA